MAGKTPDGTGALFNETQQPGEDDEAYIERVEEELYRCRKRMDALGRELWLLDVREKGHHKLTHRETYNPATRKKGSATHKKQVRLGILDECGETGFPKARSPNSISWLSEAECRCKHKIQSSDDPTQNVIWVWALVFGALPPPPPPDLNIIIVVYLSLCLYVSMSL